MRRAHVESIVCAAMIAVACEGSPNRYGGFSSGPGVSLLPSFDGGPGARDAAATGQGHLGDGGADAAPSACTNCPGGDVCCSDPSSADYGTCYSSMCVGCCQGGGTPGSCSGGASCGSNQYCCQKAGSLEYERCFPKTCPGCCQGGVNVPDAGGDASVCGACIGGMICCSTPGALQFGQCYLSSCTSCCQ